MHLFAINYEILFKKLLLEDFKNVPVHDIFSQILKWISCSIPSLHSRPFQGRVLNWQWNTLICYIRVYSPRLLQGQWFLRRNQILINLLGNIFMVPDWGSSPPPRKWRNRANSELRLGILFYIPETRTLPVL